MAALFKKTPIALAKTVWHMKMPTPQVASACGGKYGAAQPPSFAREPWQDAQFRA